jgi:protein-L-isoaspartate(D-aspartate) O-methyltransferase
MTEASAERASERAAMVRDIEAEWHVLSQGLPIPALPDRVKEVFLAVPRHRFVPEALADRAYDDAPLPIGEGQTISQPFIVALMTALLDPQPDEDILEIGTGSGYQAAILARLCRHVYGVEYIDSLAKSAAARLKALGIDNVSVRSGDGCEGWPGHPPFAGIIVTAAAAEIPAALSAQLAPGGRMVIPVGQHGGIQQLQLIEKSQQGEERRHDVLAVAFVPLVH